MSKKVLKQILKSYKNDGWEVEEYDGYYPGEEVEANIVKRFICYHDEKDDVYIYVDENNDVWTSDPYNGDIKRMFQ